MHSATAHDASGGPHQGQPVRTGGAPLARARAAMVMVHGRGASAEQMLSLAEAFAQPEVAYLAPQAAGRTWYPRSFLASLEENEPGLSSGLQAVEEVFSKVQEESRIPSERTALLGFSQGACLALEFAARRGQSAEQAPRLGGVVALSGALIGNGERPGEEPPQDKRFDYEGDLAGTPVFLGCSDRDSHIPLARVRTSAEVFRKRGAEVTERIYEGMGHAINEDEVKYVRGLLARLAHADTSS